MKKILLFSFMLLSALVTESWAQERTISGKVTSAEDGSTMPGVNVVLKGTTNGTITDVDGNYKLSVPSEGGILTFSFVGLTTEEVEIGTQSVIDLAMSADVKQLSEVVVTGVAGETDKRKLGFSVGTVGADVIENAPGVNAATALQGKIAGVTITQPNGAPGSDAAINLRSAVTLMGSQSPLIIIDGILTQGDGNLRDINSEDIASIEVVKGAAAASMYGSRAANGVVNIITKKGAEKAGSTSVSIRNEFGQSFMGRQMPLATHHPYEMSATDPTVVDYSQISPGQIADNEYSVVNDLQSETFNPGQFMTNTISIGSTFEKTRMFASFSNSLQSGVVPLSTGYDRQNVRLNLDHEISDKFSLRMTSMYSESENDNIPQGSGSPFYTLLFLPPDVDLHSKNEEDGSNYNYDVGEPASLERNPLYTIANVDRTTKRNRFLGGYTLEYRPIDALKIEGSYTLDRTNNQYEQFIAKGYLSDDFSGVANGNIRRTFNTTRYETLSGKMTFNKEFGDFNVIGQGYVLQEKSIGSYTAVEANDFIFRGVRSFSNTGLDPDSGLNRTTSDSEDIEEITQNFYLIAKVDYQGKLIVDGLFRQDKSSLFGADNRSNLFYRASLAYRLTEDFDIPQVQELKVRGSYGTAGNRPTFVARYETYDNGVKENVGNELLKSPVSTEIEVGLDAEFLNMFNLNFSYSTTNTVDPLWNKDLASIAGGFKQQWQNLDAEVKGDVLELTLGAKIIDKNDLTVSSNLIFSKVTQKIIRFDNAPFLYGPSNAFILQEGSNLGVIYGEKFARSIDELSISQQEADTYVINSDGYVVRTSEIGTVDEKAIIVQDETGNTKFEIGDIVPDFNLGLNFTVNYKGIRLYALFDWKQGGDIYNQTKQWTMRELRHADVDQSGKPQAEKKPVNYYANFYNVNATTDYFIEDGGFLKFRELALSYNLPQSILDPLKIFKAVKIGIVGRNLLTFTKYTGYDPEVASTGDANGDFGDQYFGFDGFGYPNFRTLSGSIEFKF
ncbi:MAG: SusC/RagA family TonB-linked outer membrane protein [Cyclobacteriaceae bacterium]|nr:SusC/RagA family TonB-linked outer membrane protein [Cyclobacteriaceae bacterium]